MSPLRDFVMGIDPSLTATGIANTYGGLSTVGGDASVGDARLDRIARHVASETRALGDLAQLVVIEDLPTHAHGAGISGMVQGVIRLTLIRLGVPYVTVVGSSLKKYATGKGNATKADMRMELYQRTGCDERDDNRVDAFWLRQMGLAAVGHPDAIPMPQRNREALLKVAWPEDVAARLLKPYETAVTG